MCAEYFTEALSKQGKHKLGSSLRFCSLRLMCSPKKPCLSQIGPKPCFDGGAHEYLSYTSLQGKVEAYMSFLEATQPSWWPPPDSVLQLSNTSGLVAAASLGQIGAISTHP